MSLLDRLTVVGAKSEVTAGTAIALADANSNFHSFNWAMERDIEMEERPGGTGFSQEGDVDGPRMARATFETHYMGSGADGTPPFWMDPLAKACACTITGDVLTCGTTTTTATIAAYKNGLKEGLAGAAGTFRVVWEPGKAPRIFWTFTGKEIADADVTMLAPTYPSTLPPRWAGGTCTIHGNACQVSRAELDIGNEVYARPDPTDSTGVIAALAVDRIPFLSLDPEATLVATVNWQSIMQARTQGAVSMATGSGAGNVLTLTSSTAQVVQAPVTSRSKIVTRDLKLKLCGTSPLTITQT